MNAPGYYLKNLTLFFIVPYALLLVVVIKHIIVFYMRRLSYHRCILEEVFIGIVLFISLFVV